MKAITVLQPWAQLLVLGVKRVEIRSWKTRHRGPLFIHAGRGFPAAARERCGQEPLRGILAAAGIKSPADLPRGALLGVVTLEDCLPADQLLFGDPDRLELGWCDLRPGYWAWKVSAARRLDVPIPYQGVLGIFDVPDAICSTLPSHVLG
jgi:hypothetical protein